MSSNDNNPVPAPPSPVQRRASFAPGQKLSEMFGRNPSTAVGTTGAPSSIAAAAANAQAHQGRRVSISTLGLSGSPTQTSPFASGRSRKESMSSSTDESAIDDNEATPSTPGPSPFTRRLSFGARAMRDVRGGGPGIFNGEGFNWSDQMRSRAERTSISTSPTAASAGSINPFRAPTKSASMSGPEPPKEMPRASRAPDHFQERILKGDFYMD